MKCKDGHVDKVVSKKKNPIQSDCTYLDPCEMLHSSILHDDTQKQRSDC